MSTEISSIIGQNHSLLNSKQLHVVIFRFFLINLMYIPYILLKWWVVFLKSWTWTGYFSPSTSSSVTTLLRLLIGPPRTLFCFTNWEGLYTTSHTRLRAHDQYSSSTLIGGKGWLGLSLLHTTLEGLTEYVNARWMLKSTWFPTRHQMDRVSWSLGLFSKTTSWR